MAWGAIAEKPVEPDETKQSPGTITDPDIVFVTSDQLSRKFCHDVSEGPALVRTPIRILHRANEKDLHEFVPKARVVVIATCLQSVVADSETQRREIMALQLAGGRRLVLLCTSDHEAVQEHLERMRSRVSLVIAPKHAETSDAFHGCFRDDTPILPRRDFKAESDESRAYFSHIADKIRALR